MEHDALHFDHPSVRWVVSGMGATATAYATLKAITEHRPDIMVQAGIAGAYPTCGLHRGDVVQVASDHQADLGAWRGDRFEPLEQQRHTASITIDNLPGVNALSANTACSPVVIRSSDQQIETMEGAAFLDVCSLEGVSSLQIRAISNFTTDPRHEWQIVPALEKLKDSLQSYIAGQDASE